MSPENVLRSGYLPELAQGKYYRGKVRDCYIQDDQRIMVATDRVSAFDRVLNSCLPDKGAILNAISVFSFKATVDIVKNHLIELPDPNVMVVEETFPVPVEFVVRGYLAGSAWRAVQEGSFKEKFGFELSNADVVGKVQQNAKLKRPIITPTTKSESHDRPLTREEAKGLVGDIFPQIEEVVIALYERGAKIARGQGLTLVDSKYEFGRTKEDGELMLIDELHTPDSSRYWDTERPHTELSKQYIRDIVAENQGDELSEEQIEEARRRYIELYERLTNKTWKGSRWPVKERVLLNLQAKGYIEGCYVQIIAGSKSDSWLVEQLEEELVARHIPYGETVCSAHRETWKLLAFNEQLNRSIEPVVIIAVAGKSDALSGILAANSKFPVIACPPHRTEDYAINIHSSLQMPTGAPVMVVPNPANAVLATEKILRQHDGKTLDRVE